MIVERIRGSLADRLGSNASAARELKEIFSEIDEDGNGKLSYREFKSAMKDLNVSSFTSWTRDHNSNNLLLPQFLALRIRSI